ncbi:glutathione S-transferase [Alcanivorax sp. HI0033]|jgi:glutathione S-transferase|uniref:glutathione S-transferase N-terminal domain-containing protein n=1 Tax=unclassified Alcanivorax TaxID=2638842 RepID=UPI000789DA76|nr:MULTISPECIES: glutathione S-transferase N-terminal domain-containing protein [unclassified Alcanivorax]KZX73217.1 glutathione S-transferase [Alcanivorax sp. HI0011]KZX84648.1 glutathione S-transferase [Alcanivorax sp. HI0013]KZY07633.1 glutathione S-transferase [Alcanivorax sp. HI0035]MEE2602594.1 glutathione S-transferase N-terminal domain-containing protein [Pseudomonadota bacterium]KZX62173.1 glutathione S-transferase [Alcanivorax sp. HI0003]
MSHNTEVLRSLAASALQQGRGIASKGHRKNPQEPLELYDMEGCPFCRLVREALTDLDLDVLIFPCPKGGERYRPLVERLGGRQQFPYLMDPNTGAALYESADIIDYLYREYGGRPAPRRWLVRSLRTAAAVSASLPRASRGLHALDSKTPEQALELYSFEASPFARLVRERLTELQLPYLLRQCGRDQWQDWVLPPMRRRLLSDYSPRQRNRIALMERAGRIAVPYLVDPNTGTELFESADILDYLDQTYGR